MLQNRLNTVVLNNKKMSIGSAFWLAQHAGWLNMSVGSASHLAQYAGIVDECSVESAPCY